MMTRSAVSRITTGRCVAKGPPSVDEMRIANGFARMNSISVAWSRTRKCSGMYTLYLSRPAQSHRPSWTFVSLVVDAFEVDYRLKAAEAQLTHARKRLRESHRRREPAAPHPRHCRAFPDHLHRGSRAEVSSRQGRRQSTPDAACHFSFRRMRRSEPGIRPQDC